MVFRNFAGGIVWWRVILIIIVVAVVLVYFLFPSLLGLGNKPVVQPTATKGTAPQEPEIDPSLIKPFSGIALDNSYECGQEYCIQLRSFEGEEYTVSYPKSIGRFNQGAQLIGTGVINGKEIESVTIGRLGDDPSMLQRP